MTYEEALTLCRNSKRLTEKQSRQVHRVADKLLYDSKSSSDDIGKGISLYEAAASAKDYNAEYNLAYYYGNGKKRDYKRSIEWYMRAAKHGDSWAMHNLSYAYHNGEGVEVDNAKAVYWLKKAAKKGDSLAQFTLSNIYFEGVYVRKNRPLAMKLLILAAEKGEANAQYNLSCHYRSGGRHRSRLPNAL